MECLFKFHSFRYRVYITGIKVKRTLKRRDSVKEKGVKYY